MLPYSHDPIFKVSKDVLGKTIEYLGWKNIQMNLMLNGYQTYLEQLQRSLFEYERNVGGW